MKMNPYLGLVIVGICLLIPQGILTACGDEILYCFDSNDNNLGEIVVGSCWKWARLSCQPCGSDTTSRKISYHNYKSHCRHFYPDTTMVLNTKTVWANRVRDALNELAIGK
jgi:hypothetical protein